MPSSKRILRRLNEDLKRIEEHQNAWFNQTDVERLREIARKVGWKNLSPFDHIKIWKNFETNEYVISTDDNRIVIKVPIEEIASGGLHAYLETTLRSLVCLSCSEILLDGEIDECTICIAKHVADLRVLQRELAPTTIPTDT